MFATSQREDKKSFLKKGECAFTLDMKQREAKVGKLRVAAFVTSLK